MDYQVSEMNSVRAAPERTSDIIARIARENQADRISVGGLLDALKDRGFGVLIILFALPNAIIPVAWVLGTPILLFAIQLILGQRQPWLPEIMTRQEISGRTFARAANYVVRYLSMMERWLKPRLTWLTTPPMERVIGLWLVFLTLVLLVPVPFGNALPSFSIAIIAAGLIEKDGAAIIVGSLIGIVGTLYIALLLGGILTAFRAIIGA